MAWEQVEPTEGAYDFGYVDTLVQQARKHNKRVVLLWFGKTEVSVVGDTGGTELWVGAAHLPVSVIARSAEVPKTAKSAALGRQLDPAAYVVHRAWVGPMVLLILDDPDDPTPYWLVSCRHPERVLAALRG